MSDSKRVSFVSETLVFSADIKTYTDYYAFGMEMVGRAWSEGEAYRQGYNGKENDKDFGEGVQDYGFRIYDNQIGKFLSVDPLTQSYPWYTPYQFAGNKPITFIDLDGCEEELPKGQEDYSKLSENPTIIKNKNTTTIIRKIDENTIEKLIIVNNAQESFVSMGEDGRECADASYRMCKNLGWKEDKNYYNRNKYMVYVPNNEQRVNACDGNMRNKETAQPSNEQIEKNVKEITQKIDSGLPLMSGLKCYEDSEFKQEKIGITRNVPFYKEECYPNDGYINHYTSLVGYGLLTNIKTGEVKRMFLIADNVGNGFDASFEGELNKLYESTDGKNKVFQGEGGYKPSRLATYALPPQGSTPQN